MDHVDFQVLGLLDLVYFVLDAFDLFAVAHLDFSERLVVDDSVDQFFLGDFEPAFKVDLGSHELFLLVADVGFLRLVNVFHFIYDLVDEFVRELQSAEFLGNLVFKLEHFDVFVITFFLIVGSVAMIVRFILEWMVFGGISLSALVAEHETAQ